MPDIFAGDARVPTELLSPEERDKFDRNAWVAKHGPETWEPILDSVVSAVKAKGISRIATTGYCFGAPPGLYLALNNTAHVTVFTHPSRLQVPADLEVSDPSHSVDAQGIV